MAVIGSITIGMAVDRARMIAGLGQSRRDLQKFNSDASRGGGGGFGGMAGQAISLGTALKTAAIGFGALKVAGAIKDVFVGGIKGASDLNEQVSKSQVVFGAASATVEKSANDMAKSFGYPKAQFIEAAGSIGLIGKASGLNRGAAAQLGTDFAKLGADVASFYNVPVEEALRSIKSGLVGEAEPMRRFGVLLSESAVKAEGLRLGLIKGKQEMTDQAKVQARASLITKGLSDAQGDLARTATSPANAMRILQGTVTNLATDLGATLMPAIQLALTGALTFADGLRAGFEGAKATIGEWVNTTITLITNLPLVWDLTVLQFRMGVLSMIEFIKVLPENLLIVGTWIANEWPNLIADGLSLVQTVFTNLWENLKNGWQAVMTFFQTGEFSFNWKPLTEGFEAITAALPELVAPAVTDTMKEINDEIAAKQTALTTAGAERIVATEAAATGTKAPVAVAEKAAETMAEPMKRAGALEMGSKEARSAVLEARGMLTGDTMKDLAKTGQKQEEHQRKMVSELEKINAGTGTTGMALASIGP